MPSYLGVSQKDILNSITQAVDFLKAHPTGPALDAILQKIEAAAAPGAPLAEAKTDDELVDAIYGSNIKNHLIWTNDLLNFHALRDTQKKGIAIQRGLDAWNALSAARKMVLTPIDQEIDAYIRRQPARKITAAMNKAARRVMPLGNYGIVIDGLAERRVETSDPSIAALRQAANAVLAPFASQDAVMMCGIGLLGASEGKRPQGLRYTCTRQAAEALAAAFPAHKVLDPQGKTIKPPRASAPKRQVKFKR